ncbi:MAG: response regulator [Chloroflexota bacterium]|jgi:CheY-like chemotaxis protein|nr:response regulator [Chloroflexota bacterium]
MSDHKPTVLVIDDNPALVYLLHAFLNGSGYHVVNAIARDAVPTARELRPAVILLDIAMPELDGVQVCELLRADPDTASIPVIALSAQINLHIHAAAMQADAYLSKPFELSILLETVERWASRRSDMSHRTQHAALPAATPAYGALRARIAAVEHGRDTAQP